MAYFLFRFLAYSLLLLGNLGLSYFFVLHVFGLTQQHFDRYLWQIPVYLASYFLYGLFSIRTISSREFVETLKANMVALLFVMLFLFAGKLGDMYSRKVVFVFFLFNILIPVYMYFIKRIFMKMPWLREPVIAICDDKGFENIKNWFVKDNAFGFDIERVVRIENLPNGSSGDVRGILEGGGYYALIIAVSTQKTSRMFYLIDKLQPVVKRIIIVPSLARVPLVNVEIVSSINNKGLAFFVNNNLLNPFYRTLKDISDLLLAFALSVGFMPLLVLLYLVVFVDTKGHPVFTQERMGRSGKPFQMFKFRTMKMGADKELDRMLEEDSELAREWRENFKLKNDPRVTKIGRFLRKTSLDELPQLLNVLKGEMSLVGPRPIVRDEIEKYGEYFEYYKLVKPGITGLWQVSGRNDVSYDERVMMDVWYVRNWSFEMDFVILLKTLGSVLTGRGSY